MNRIEIRSFHCIVESTWGRLSGRRNARRHRESDEIAFVVAFFPIDTHDSQRWTDWTYAEDEEPQFRVRSSTDVDSGEDHVWQHPIAFKFEPRADRIYELILNVYEVDGGSETSKQAQNIHNNLRNKLNDDFRPGLAIGSSPNSIGNSGPTTYATPFEYVGDGGNDDLLCADVWHVDSNDSLADFNIPSIPARTGGRIDPDLQIDEQVRGKGIVKEISRFPAQATRVIERREYGSRPNHSRYRFDVHYSA